jgi:cupin 2 domain-containing protein
MRSAGQGVELKNLFAGLPEDFPEEVIEILLQTSYFRLERIVSAGQASPPGFWYDQDAPEWVALLSGGAQLLFEGDPEPIALKPGDFLLIPAHRRHRVEWTDPEEKTVWLALHFKE